MSAALALLDRPRAMPAVASALGGHGSSAPCGLAVELRGVVKQFGDRPVLERIDLAVPAGRFIAIVGRSGGGKSTLLRLLAGLETPSAGDIHLDGRPVAGAIQQADIGQGQLGPPLPALATGDADIVDHALPGQQARVLEQHPHPRR